MTAKSKIDNFEGEFRFLSNFAPSIVHFDGMEFSTVEHAYQAAKTFDKDLRLKIRNAKTPNEAKKFGKKIKLREDWEDVKIAVMLGLLEQKFAIPELRQLLLNTGEAELIEGNWWGDTFWGVCKGRGQNHLGKLLMAIRKRIA